MLCRSTVYLKRQHLGSTHHRVHETLGLEPERGSLGDESHVKYLSRLRVPEFAPHVLLGLEYERKGRGRRGLDSGRPRQRGYGSCLLYTSPSPRDRTRSRMPSSA